jgi:hypothetical protein
METPSCRKVKVKRAVFLHGWEREPDTVFHMTNGFFLFFSLSLL